MAGNRAFDMMVNEGKKYDDDYGEYHIDPVTHKKIRRRGTIALEDDRLMMDLKKNYLDDATSRDVSLAFINSPERQAILRPLKTNKLIDKFLGNDEEISNSEDSGNDEESKFE